MILKGTLAMIFPINDSLFCINDSKGFSSNDFSINDYLFCINDSKGYSTNDIPYQRFGSLLAMIPLVKSFIMMIFYQINLNNDLYCYVPTDFASLYQCFDIVSRVSVIIKKKFLTNFQGKKC